MTNDAITARRIALGAVRRGSTVSSPSELAVSKPYMTYALASDATRNAPKYPSELSAIRDPAVSTMTLGGFTMFTASRMISSTAAMSSMNTPGAVDPRHELDPERVDQLW